ncbi:MAG TPA: DUF6174 domain-containing protein [Chloroflexia bacterium]|nr:DUF6174 domain-containing protein [Chloroflexia bacterium]
MKKIIFLAAVLLLVAIPYGRVILSTEASEPANTGSTKTYSPESLQGSASPTIAFPYINITKADYEAALAKWRSHGIQDYEMQVSGSTNSYPYIYSFSETDRVRGPVAEVIYYSCTGICMTITMSTATPLHKAWSVEDMFTTIQEIVDDPQGTYSSRGVRYEVAFDPVYSYPTLIDVIPVSVDHGWGKTVVQGITILKASSSPIIPSYTAEPVP